MDRHLSELHQRELDAFHRAFAARNEAGLFDALVYCKREKLEVPEWALDAVITRQREFIFGETKRHANWLRRFKQDMIDFDRAETVRECREHGAPWKVVFEIASRMLEGTENEGGPDAIAKSYKRFKHTLKTAPLRYYLPRFIRFKERRKPLTREYSEWFMKTFPGGKYK